MRQDTVVRPTEDADNSFIMAAVCGAALYGCAIGIVVGYVIRGLLG